MGSDCGYSCDYADQEPVERLVALVTRWCEDEERSFRLVNVRNCSLEETALWPTPFSPECLKLVAEIFGKTLVTGDAELTADYEAECDYLHNARQRVDLLGVVVDAFFDWQLPFIFDFHADGRLVSFEPEDPADYQAMDKQIRCQLSLSGYY